MWNRHLFGLLYLVFVTLMLTISLIEGKGYSSGRGGGGIFKSSPKGSGSFGGPMNQNRMNSMGKPRSGSGMKNAAIGFAAGAAGGLVAHSVMRSMMGSYRSRPEGYYGPGYGGGETCVNNEDFNGTVIGKFRCPIYGYNPQDKYCCGEPGHQECCARRSGRPFRGASHLGWIAIIIVVVVILILLWVRRRRQQQKDVIMVPTEPPMNEFTSPPPFYHPAPPPAGYPPPPHGYPYTAPPQNYPGNFNPYAQPSHMPYPPQQQQQFNNY